jgi:hypothetical protein
MPKVLTLLGGWQSPTVAIWKSTVLCTPEEAYSGADPAHLRESPNLGLDSFVHRDSFFISRELQIFLLKPSGNGVEYIRILFVAAENK